MEQAIAILERLKAEMQERTTKESISKNTKTSSTDRSQLDELVEGSFIEFETFGDNVLLDAVNGAKEFVRSKEPRWISFVGSSGTGKTMLAQLTFAAKLKAKPSLQFHETLTNGARMDFWPEVATSLRGQDFWRSDAVINARLVLLDEIAVEHDPSGFLKDKLAEILSRRVGKWTILTSNLTMKALGALDTRIPSRMIRDGSIVFDMSTKDYALRRK